MSVCYLLMSFHYSWDYQFVCVLCLASFFRSSICILLFKCLKLSFSIRMPEIFNAWQVRSVIHSIYTAQVLLRRFQITHNLSLDGVIDFLNSKNMTEAGPMDLIDDDNSDTEEGVEKQTRGKLDYDLPGALPNHGRPTIRTKCLKIAPTGRNFVAATTEGVLVYSIDESFIFDPTDLDIDVTPEVLIKTPESLYICAFLVILIRKLYTWGKVLDFIFLCPCSYISHCKMIQIMLRQ